MPVPTRPIIDRFFSHVLPVSCGCWLWTGAASTAGYGKFGLHTSSSRRIHVIDTHIFSWILHTRLDIPKGICVCHKCDIKRCVNPNHLFLGTYSDNMQDCASKGRLSHQRATCEDHGHAKLNWKKVDQIRFEYTTGSVSQSQLAEKFGVGQTAISDILLEKTWNHQRRNESKSSLRS